MDAGKEWNLKEITKLCNKIRRFISKETGLSVRSRPKYYPEETEKMFDIYAGKYMIGEIYVRVVSKNHVDLLISGINYSHELFVDLIELVKKSGYKDVWT